MSASNGVFTFPGHGYGLGAARATAAADEGRALAAASASLRSAGFDDIVASGGCTPTATLTHEDVVNELRPGVYVFMDAGQLAMGAATPDQVALTVRTTVVSNAVPGQVVLDAGAKVLAMDRLAFIAPTVWYSRTPRPGSPGCGNITVSSRPLRGHHARPSANSST